MSKSDFENKSLAEVFKTFGDRLEVLEQKSSEAVPAGIVSVDAVLKLIEQLGLSDSDTISSFVAKLKLMSEEAFEKAVVAHGGEEWLKRVKKTSDLLKSAGRTVETEKITHVLPGAESLTFGVRDSFEKRTQENARRFIMFGRESQDGVVDFILGRTNKHPDTKE